MQKHFTINFVPIINGKFQEQMITGTPANDIKVTLTSVISKLTDKLKDKYQTIRVDIVNIVTKPVSEKEYKNLESSFFEFE
ncbi:MAG: hypothetical protein V4685_11240 [Bacteroidota bacterium]